MSPISVTFQWVFNQFFSDVKVSGGPSCVGVITALSALDSFSKAPLSAYTNAILRGSPSFLKLASGSYAILYENIK